MKSFMLILCFLFSVFISTQLEAQELTLYTIPSPSEINWSSPRSLFRGAVANNLTLRHKKAKRAIGHVFIELRHTERGERILTGSSTQKDEDDSFSQIFRHRIGLGILFHDIAGRLEKTSDLLAELPDRLESGRISYIRFLISDETYDRLKSFLEEYRARGYGNIYNGLNLPREGLGAGCSIFGITFLELAGVMHPVWREIWPVRVRIPMHLIGGKYNPDNRVMTFDMMRTSSWAEENEPHKELMLYEPYYIHRWILSEWRREYEQKTGRVRLLMNNNAYGLEYDARQVPTPEDPIFQGAAANYNEESNF